MEQGFCGLRFEKIHNRSAVGTRHHQGIVGITDYPSQLKFHDRVEDVSGAFEIEFLHGEPLVLSVVEILS
jgi:hypothetical protein